MNDKCANFSEHNLDCICNKNITSTKPFPPCDLIHSKVPKHTEKGIEWICKEGCDENKQAIGDTDLNYPRF